MSVLQLLLSSIVKKLRFRDLFWYFGNAVFLVTVAQVKFVDRTFNCLHIMRGHMRYLLDIDNGVTNFHFEVAADLLDE